MSDKTMPICLLHSSPEALTETFIRAHAELLPARVTLVSRRGDVPYIGNRPVISQSFLRRGLRAVRRQFAAGQPEAGELTLGYARAVRQSGARAVLAEYGPVGVAALDACRSAGVPLIVHFHGYDASKHAVLRQYQDGYQKLFRYASAIIAVSRHMERRLLAMGAPRSKLIYNPYGVDCDRFEGASPESAASTLIAVGRFVEKKAPHLTLCSFARVCQRHPEARLRMIGDGPLLGPCRDLAAALGIDDRVTFLGPQSHEVVLEELKCARAFVQHSVEASDGDCEGTPVAILEASAIGLPVIATRHAGIPDVVVSEEAGVLVNERDVEAMADGMQRLLADPDLAGRFGRAGRQRVSESFSMDRSISNLWTVISNTINGLPIGSGLFAQIGHLQPEAPVIRCANMTEPLSCSHQDRV